MTRAATAIDKTDWLVGELRRMARTRALQYALEVGRLIVTHVFDGSLANLQTQGRNDTSYRKLSERTDLPFSPITLWRCVKIFELVERFPAVLGKQHLALAHLRAVAALPPATQEALLDQAQENAWTSEELVRAARRTRIGKSDVATRTPRALVRTTRRLRQLAGELEAALDAAPQQLQARFSAASRAALESVRVELASLEASFADERDQGLPAGDKRTSGVHRIDRQKGNSSSEDS